MTVALKAVAIVSLVASIYSYFIYPLLLLAIPKRRSGAVAETSEATSSQPPRVSLIVACYNEESQLAEKLDNCLAIDYPTDRLEIIVASDASGDRSHEIAEGYAECGVRLIASPERRGKEHAQGLAVAESTGDIVVFTDCGSRVEPRCLRTIVARMVDPDVAALSSEDRVLTAEGRVEGEGLYQRYEMWLRRLESDRSSLIGLTGALFAVRREACTPWDSSVDSDFRSALNAVRSGKVAVTEPNLLCIYKGIDDPKREYQRKVRTVLRGMSCLGRYAGLLNPFRWGLISFQLWSHKVARWATPWAMVTLLIASLLLVRDSGFFRVLLFLQLVFYGVSLLGLLTPAMRRLGPVRVISFFTLANVAILQAGVLYSLGRRVGVWEPTKR
ncbi:Beta-monoglucosyldiacylglycerol synthase [Pseudobythopirellula maris]|uniref:Beta-monoglucosyldiacylglycerol synthase n=1 Tax=Pseudobythopirellula maris TaxID=2527991 RepID=A0A5C5ZRN1_9BACT|nr:glycosyltransferase family 2 protein [Pseudobythopirellula maris]TWT89745.1 Beta-monoglucosyldiacylglycerol synthase [Pseudobythopirellula maris]